MHIAVISNNYPKNFAPNHGAFVYNLVQKLANFAEITVISTLKVHEAAKYKTGGYGDERCHVIRPVTLSLSNKKIGFLDTGRLTNLFARYSVEKTLSRMNEAPDVLYCHFFSNAITVLNYVEKNNLPLVVASGESTYSFFDRLTSSEKERLRKKIDKVICVSQSNIDRLVHRGFAKDKLVLVPNAVDHEVFKPMDQTACKEKLGFSNQDFVVGFIGHFIERKGPNRLIQAIQTIKDSQIKLVCVGDGDALIENDFTTILSPMPSNQLPEVFNAFDVFVLPTLHEGHCNVIEEAMACGIPVISSKGTSVEDQLKDGKGVLVDPMSIDAISNAICNLKEDDVRYGEIVRKLLHDTRKNSLNERAKKVHTIIAAEVVEKI